MKKLNILLILFSIILFSSFVSASDINNNKGFYPMTHNCTGNSNGVEGVNSGATFINYSEGCDFEESESDKVIVDSSVIQTGCIDGWVNSESNPAYSSFASSSKFTSGPDQIASININPSGTHYQADSFSSINTNAVDLETVDTGSWHYIVSCWNSDSHIIKSFFDGVRKANDTTFTKVLSTMNKATIGASAYRSGYIRYADAKIMGVGFWNDTLSDEFILLRYSSGRTYNPLIEVNNFTITTKNKWNNSALTDFSALVNGTLYNDSGTGTITTPIQTDNINLFDITIIKDYYFNQTYNNVNASVNNSVDGSLYQTNITLNFLYANGENIQTPSNLTAYNSSDGWFLVENGTINIFPSASQEYFNIRCDSEVFAPFNFTLNLTALEIGTYNYTVNETQTILTFLDLNTTDPIENATITITYPSGEIDTRTTNSSGQINFSYIYNDVLEFGDYNFNIAKLGFINTNFSETINISNIPFNKTYNISRATLNIFVYYRDTSTLINDANVNINMVGVFNDTTSTGLLTKNNLSVISGEYTVFASLDGYTTEINIFDFSNQEIINISLYLTNISESGILTVTTQDNYYRRIPNSLIQLMQYDDGLLSYIKVSECLSNIDGECDFYITLNTKRYYIRASNTIDGNTVTASTSTSGEIFTTSGQTRNLIFYTQTEFIESILGRLVYDIDESFINNVSEISVDFYTTDGNTITMCVEYFKLIDSSYVSQTGDTYCVASSSALQNIPVSITLNRSNNYKAEVHYTTTNNRKVILKTYSYPSIESFEEIFNDDFKSVLVVLSWIMVLALALYMKNISLFFIFGIVLSWLEVLFMPTFTILYVSVFKSLICVIGLYVAKKKRDYY